MPRPTLDPATPLTELHVHLGAAVTPAIMWGIAHAQGIRLPTKDYWEFRDLITVGRRRRSFQAYLDLFHWTELIQSSPTAVERSVYEVIGGAYRKNNVTRLELRFNPMKRNRGGEQDLDHIIAAAVRGMDRAVLEYPQVRAGLIFCLDRAFDYELNEIIAAKAIAWRGPWRGGGRHRRPGVAQVPLRRLPRPVRPGARRAGLGVTVHAGETGGPEEVREAVEALEPTRIGHGIRSTRDVRVLAMLRERGVVLEVCPSSNLNTRVIRTHAELREIMRALVDHEVRFALSTDGPEMLRSYLRDEIAMLLRREILSLEEVERAIATARDASFVDRAPVPGGARPRTDGRDNGHAAIALEVEV